MDNEKEPEAFRTISEVAGELEIPQHVLRFWETRFPPVKPLKRGGGRRYYRPDDVELLYGIKRLLYDEGYTIKGVQKILRVQKARWVVAFGRGEKVSMTELDDEIDDTDSSQGEAETMNTNESPAKSPPITDGDDSHSNAKTSKGLSGLYSASPKKGQVNLLSNGDLKKLEKVIVELLDCKRLLDRSCQNS